MKSSLINTYILKILGFYQFITAFWFAINYIYDPRAVTKEHLILGSILFIPFVVLGICAGVSLFLYNKIKLSIVNQFLQVIIFKLFGTGFYYWAGASIRLGIYSNESSNIFYYKTEWFSFIVELMIDHNINESYFIINIVPIIILILLFKLKGKDSVAGQRPTD